MADITKRRHKIEQIHDILRTCLQPSRFTYIVRLANMQTVPLKKTLPTLERKGYLDKAEVGQDPRKFKKKTYFTWQTTMTGQQIMREIKTLTDKIIV